jgi:hypothetical protein
MSSVSDVIGFLASGLVLATFAMKDMRFLRWTAILSNLAFIAYGLQAALMPVLVLHVLLLPLNVCRLLDALARPKQEESPGYRTTNKATRMAIEALLLADAARERKVH